MATMTKRPFSGTSKAFIKLEEWRASKCDRCLGFGHLAVQCDGTDRSKSCWRCGADGHTVTVCTGKLRCYLCAETKGNPRIDHLPRSTKCAVFREAAPKRKPWEAARRTKQATQETKSGRLKSLWIAYFKIADSKYFRLIVFWAFESVSFFNRQFDSRTINSLLCWKVFTLFPFVNSCFTDVNHDF